MTGQDDRNQNIILKKHRAARAAIQKLFDQLDRNKEKTNPDKIARQKRLYKNILDVFNMLTDIANEHCDCNPRDKINYKRKYKLLKEQHECLKRLYAARGGCLQDISFSRLKDFQT